VFRWGPTPHTGTPSTKKTSAATAVRTRKKAGPE
jgi:hypothetical protein